MKIELQVIVYFNLSNQYESNKPFTSSSSDLFLAHGLINNFLEK